jgi:hypothetical protein
MKIVADKFRLLSLLVLVLGLATASLAVWRLRTPTPIGSGFILHSKMTFRAATGGPTEVRGSRVRYQKSDGSFKQITSYLNVDGKPNRTVTLLGLLGRGVFEFAQNDQAIAFVSAMRSQIPPVSETELRKIHHHNALRDATVLGYKTLVVRLPGDSPDSYTELYHAIDLQGFQIKTVSVSDAGTSIFEPTKIEAQEPSSENFDLPKLPISYERFEQKIKALEESGQTDTAELMRQQLRDAKKP